MAVAGEDLYRTLFDNMPYGVASCRMLFEDERPVDLVYLTVNPAFATLTGLADVVGRRLTEVVPGIRETDPQLFEILGRVARRGKPRTFETFVRALDKWFDMSVFSPRPDHFIAVFEDVTRRKRAEERRQNQSESLRLLTEAIDDVFWMAAPGFARMEYVSPAYERVWGRSCASLYDHPLSWAEAVHPHDRHALNGLLAAFGHAEMNVQYRIVRPDGDVRWIHHRRFPVRDAKGRITHFASMAADVTRAKTWREETRQAQKMEALGTFAGGIAHDFNNILTGILGFAQLIPGDVGDSELLADDVKQIRQAAGRAKDLVKQILTYSRSIEVTKVPVDLVALAQEFQPLIRASVPSRIRVDVSAGVEQAIVMAAAVNIHQLLLNLCMNGADAIGDAPGNIVISVDAAEGMVRLAVADSGEGIDETVRDRIFDPFFTTKASGKGSGLGLAVVKGIVDDMGGTITVDSDHTGTRFEILLPERREPVESEESDDGEPVRTRASASAGRALVVDDEAAVIALLARFFRRMGWSVATAASAPEALALVAEGEAFDVVVTDQGMPDMSGVELAGLLRAQLPDVRVVLISGREAPSPETLADAGIDAFVPKPIDLLELEVALSALDERAAIKRQ
jgi:PAS domain S-box-containing protein